MKVIDDDEVNVELFNKEAEADLKAMDEDAPQIVGIIDERPFEMRIGDYRDTAKWKPIGIKTEDGDDAEENDQHNVPIYIEDDVSTERKITTFRIGYSNVKTDVEVNKETESNFNNKKSNSKSDDLSPRRRRVTRNEGMHDRDLSPQRKFKRKSSSPESVRNMFKKNDYIRNKSVTSKDPNAPKNAGFRKENVSTLRIKDRDSHKQESNFEKHRSFTHTKFHEEISTLRKHSGDLSPERKRRSEDHITFRKRRDSDLTPPRKRIENKEKPKMESSGAVSSPTNHHISDLSPKRRQVRDKDNSPPRKPRRSPLRKKRESGENHTTNSSDVSPPRRHRACDSSPTRDNRGSPRPQSSENRERNKIKTSDGKSARRIDHSR